MMKLDGIAAFVATVEAGSISAASRRLGLAKSVVSERLAELERCLDARLIQRTTRKLSLTENGHSFLPRAQRILREVDEAAAELAARSGTLAGPLRLSAPVGFGTLHLGPALCTFLQEHREIEVSLELDDRFVDAAADGFDAVLRHGAVSDTRLIAKRLTSSRRLLVASQAYLEEYGHPRSLAELVHHRGILYANREGDWRFAAGDGWSVIRPKPGLRVNNGVVMKEAATAGLGIALLPTFFVHESVATGTLVTIDVGAKAEGAELFVTYARNHGASAKIAALTESLRRSFGDPPYWDRDIPE
ncbi:putative LysR family transcriptional regulator [Novosphingobium resinovorum]|uniref:Putative LysR family transcriptional regulator n=1 Tax=Novosphingobium resinovorum TaxID=158500 RepID=A0A031JXG1_9SPHN|nr:LysR family transcriptional regulator [Novosphingobium resinovorum]EZP82416.1 putative LysR family transcriptional regulator [Novosphingobium resinovorum]